LKIRILTFHAVANYGAVLQAYALQEALRELGHDVAFIDYRPPYLTTGGSFWFPRSKWHLEANLVIAYKKLMTLKEFQGGMRAQNKRFQEFVDTNLILDGHRYRSIAELRRKPPEADLYICGSDQIWNPSKQYGVDPACFLDFGEPGVKKISYAASFGKPDVPDRHHAEIARYIEKLDRISVREASGVDLVRRLSGQQASLVPDPTFLIDWSKQKSLAEMHAARDKKQVFFYVLRDGTGIFEAQQKFSQKGYQVVQPYNPNQRWKAHGAVKAMSPWEWLSEIQQSNFVVTNSFHGTVFSILLKKPFLTLQLGGGKSGLNERMKHLLSETKLTGRIMAGQQLTQSDMDKPMAFDWDQVISDSEKMKNNGLDFLKTSIETDADES